MSRPRANYDRWTRTHAGHAFYISENGKRRCQTCPQSRATRATEIDSTAVARAVAGDPPSRMSRAERAEAIQALAERGKTWAEIQVLVRCSESTVARALRDGAA